MDILDSVGKSVKWGQAQPLDHSYSFYILTGWASFSNFGVRAWLPHSRWDLSSLTRDLIHVLCIRSQNLNHWITRKVPIPTLFKRQPLKTIIIMIKSDQSLSSWPSSVPRTLSLRSLTRSEDRSSPHLKCLPFSKVIMVELCEQVSTPGCWAVGSQSSRGTIWGPWDPCGQFLEACLLLLFHYGTEVISLHCRKKSNSYYKIKRRRRASGFLLFSPPALPTNDKVQCGCFPILYADKTSSLILSYSFIEM